MITIPQNAHDKLIRAMVKIQGDQPFFSYLLMNFKVSATIDKTIPTAGVDRRGSFFYNEDFIHTLAPEELTGLLVHECMHIAKGDFFRVGNRDKMIWNIASDMVINYILGQEGFKVPKAGINPDRSGKVTVGGKDYNVAGKATEEVYDELFANATKIHIQMAGGGNGEDKNNGHGGFDVHIEGKGEDGEEMSQAEKSEMESKWKKVIIEAATNARARGKLPGCVESLVDKILNPVIDWRSRLQKFITNEIPVDYTNRLPGRKFYGTHVWFPRILRENLNVFVSVDVSGSTMPDRVYFISEVMSILNSYEQIKARLIFWDAHVDPDNDFEVTRYNKDTLCDLKIKNCNGGTRMSCYKEYCDEKNYKSTIHLIFTDGEIEPDPELPSGNILFILSKNGSDSVVKEYGPVCKITDVED